MASPQGVESGAPGPAPAAQAGAEAAKDVGRRVENLPHWMRDPTFHYKFYDKNLRYKNWAIAGALTCFVGGVYAYTIHAVGSSDELQKAVEAYERKQRELQLQQEQEKQQQVGAPKAA